nr:alpha/beta fold hydrolase [uncultured Draconibacterium sp.]
MKHIRLTILFLTFSIGLYSQIYEGKWQGEVNDGDTTFTVELILKQKNDKISGFMMHPEWLKVVDSEPSDSVLTLISQKNKIYKLENFMISNSSINTSFRYHSKYYQVELNKEGQIIKRPQEPKKPYPYKSENIFFYNSNDSVKLAGTLTIPNGQNKFPAVILISGSSPSDRNCEGYNHRPFLVLADYLTKNGIAVLRYDDRGVNQSSGDFYQSTAIDFSEDIISAFKYLCTRKEIDTNKIGLIGHSEGGVVAGITASKYDKISFIVLLASPGIPLKNDFILQQKLKYKTGDFTKEYYEFNRRFNEVCYRMIENNTDINSATDSLSNFKEEHEKLANSNSDKKRQFGGDHQFDRLVSQSLSPHNRFNIKCDPSEYFMKVNCPVLSLNGSKDILVPAKINQDAIKLALTKAGNTNFEIIEIEGLNHSFQECKTGTMREFFEIDQTFSPIALDKVVNWILELDKLK